MDGRRGLPRRQHAPQAIPGQGPLLLNLLKPGTQTKPRQIAPILAAFPRRRFTLIGDSGEQDPEVYGALARQHSQIVRIYIRNITDESPGSDRIQAALEGLDPVRWSLFSDAADIG